jgi:hypothetical protein
MSLPTDRLSTPLPKRFPVGARYVVEGRGGENGHLRVVSRYVVLPGGRRINVPADLGQQAAVNVRVPGHSRAQDGARPFRRRSKKISGRRGTTRQQRN